MSSPWIAAALALATAALVLWCARRREAPYVTLAAMAPLAILLAVLAPAAVYSPVFLAALLCLLELDDRGKNAWILLWVPMFVAWVNLDPGCVAGVAVVACYAVEQAVRKRPFLFPFAATMLAVALIGASPEGLAHYSWLWSRLQKLDPPSGAFFLVVFTVMLVAATYAIARRGPRACRGVSILAALAAGSLLFDWVAPMFAVAWLAYVPGWVGKLRRPA